MERVFRNKKYIPLLALICALGWSMAYPLIKVGYDLFGLIMISAVCFAIYNELIAYHPISSIAIYNARLSRCSE